MNAFNPFRIGSSQIESSASSLLLRRRRGNFGPGSAPLDGAGVKTPSRLSLPRPLLASEVVSDDPFLSPSMTFRLHAVRPPFVLDPVGQVAVGNFRPGRPIPYLDPAKCGKPERVAFVGRRAAAFSGLSKRGILYRLSSERLRNKMITGHGPSSVNRSPYWSRSWRFRTTSDKMGTNALPSNPGNLNLRSRGEYRPYFIRSKLLLRICQSASSPNFDRVSAMIFASFEFFVGRSTL
jgi:hypothetical protein